MAYIIAIEWVLQYCLDWQNIAINVWPHENNDIYNYSWLIDRCATMWNIGGDISIAAIVSNKVSKNENSEKKAVGDVKETENTPHGSLPLSTINEVTSHSE